MVGVVSTQPGFVAGAYTSDSYPIGLIGRVPVKVTTENGAIKSGDYLTSSSTEGYAMKALLSGKVIGTALEDLDTTTLSTCPQTPSTKILCGELTMFLNLNEYLGGHISDLVANFETSHPTIDGGLTVNNNANASESGVIANGSFVNFDPTSVIPEYQQKVLAFLADLRSKRSIVSSQSAELLTGKITVTDSITAPLIYADEIIANRIRANQIEGMDIIGGRISLLENLTASMSSASALVSVSPLGTALSGSANLNLAGLSTTQLTATGDATFKAPVIIEALLTLWNNLVVKGEAIIEKTLTVLGNVTFKGKVTFSGDTAGSAVIPKFALTVDVPFVKPFETTPFVMITQTVKDATDSAFLSDGGKAVVSNVKTTGFTIVLDELSPRDLEYNWFAFSVDNPRKIMGKSIDALLGLPSATETPTPTKEPTPIPSDTIPTYMPTPTGIPDLPLTQDLQPLVSPKPEPLTVKIRENDLGFVRMRVSPAQEADEIAQIPVGEIVPYSDEQFGWLKVAFDGQNGWISSVVVDRIVVH
jgi:hypothetical protein